MHSKITSYLIRFIIFAKTRSLWHHITDPGQTVQTQIRLLQKIMLQLLQSFSAIENLKQSMNGNVNQSVLESAFLMDGDNFQLFS